MKKKSKLWPILLVLVVLAGAGWAAKSSGMLGEEETQALEGVPVKRGPLRISVVERGNLVAADSVTLKSEIEGRTTVLYLIEEGTVVQEGDLLCELDTSSLVDRKVSQEISVQNALASYTKAQQNFEIQESQNTSDIARAEQEVRFARDDLRKYTEEQRAQDLQKADDDVMLRQEELTLAQQDLEWSEKLAAKGFLEQTQLDADRIAKTRAEVGLAQAERAKKLLEDYDVPRAIAEFESAVEEAVRELDRVKLQAKARIADFDADLKTSKAKYELEVSELDKINDQISKAKIYAPVEGMVVYAIEDRGRWGGGEPMSEGKEVREREEIITIPSDEGYVAEASLHESILEKVHEGLPCLVTVDALGETLRAEVTFKAVLPDQQSWFANPDLRVYRTEVSILDKDPRMRPGMSCSIEILVDDLPDALHVPVQAVFVDAGHPVALVPRREDVEKRPIEVGQNNGKWVEVLSGLEQDETVLLSLPAGLTLEPAPDEPQPMDTAEWPRSKREDGPSGGMSSASTKGERGGKREDAAADKSGGQGMAGGFDLEKWKRENPEKAKQMEEAMKDPEKMRQMRERFAGGGGGRPGARGSRDQ